MGKPDSFWIKIVVVKEGLDWPVDEIRQMHSSGRVSALCPVCRALWKAGGWPRKEARSRGPCGTAGHDRSREWPGWGHGRTETGRGVWEVAARGGRRRKLSM